MSSDTIDKAQEAKRVALAKKAAPHGEAQAKLREANAALRAHDEESERDRLKAAERRRALESAKAAAQSSAQAASSAVEALRSAFVPREIKQDLAAAARAEREAEARIRQASADLSSARSTLEDAKSRAKHSGADSADLKRYIAEQEATVQPHEVRHVEAVQALEAAKGLHAEARTAFDAALAAAMAI